MLVTLCAVKFYCSEFLAKTSRYSFGTPLWGPGRLIERKGLPERNPKTVALLLVWIELRRAAARRPWSDALLDALNLG
jgi:hypothetical protein